ncbi:MAG: hypothetical protein JWL77_2875 [Chthonomonadaceae bacterium]|nr:hypothetical protein [Chthonomonadaceae bacterium]
MKQKPVIIAILTIFGLSGYFLWANSAVKEGLDPENDFANWQPTADAIRREIPAGTVAEREQAFRFLFEKRFRKHEPGKAVGVHFTSDGRIHLLTPARLEPWNVDRIALMLHQESLRDLNKNYEIDIYETFIGTPPVKIAELRLSSEKSPEVTVRYQYPASDIFPMLHPNGSAANRPADFSGPSVPPQQKPSL